jgi:hypothetical protein
MSAIELGNFETNKSAKAKKKTFNAKFLNWIK